MVEERISEPTFWEKAPVKLMPWGKACCLPGCEKPAVTKKLCPNHYQAMRAGRLDPATGLRLELPKRAAHTDEESTPTIAACFGSLEDFIYIASGSRLLNTRTNFSFSRTEAISAWGRWVVNAISAGKIKTYPNEVWSPDPRFDAGDSFNSYNVPKGLIPDDAFDEPLHEDLLLLLDNLAGSNERDLRYFMDWLAYKFQNPHKIPGALILHGSQGSGKGTLSALLEAIFGETYMKIGGGTLESDFTGWMYKRLMIIANEVNVSTNKDRANTRKRLKDYTAPDTVDIHLKYAEHFKARNHAAWIICSNDRYVVDIESDDRRFSVLHTSKQIPKELGERISEEKLDYYAKNLFNALYRRDVSQFKAGTPHENQARQAMKAEFMQNGGRGLQFPPIEN